MGGHQRLARIAVVLLVLVAAAAGVAAPAAAFSYAIDVTGDGVTGSGLIVFPADAGSDSLGVDLSLSATMFGNAVTFTEADILSVGWSGADPGDLLALVIDNLALAFTDGASTFLLSDNGGGLGDAICTDATDPFTACGGQEIALAATSWTYAEQPTAPVSVPPAGLLLLAALGVVVTGGLVRGAGRASA